MTSKTPSITHELLARAHSPDSTKRIFSEKIQHRTLYLRPSSPPPSTIARDVRRKARQDKQKRMKALKPKPLSSRQRRKLGLHTVPKEGQKYDIFAPLNQLWAGYAREVLGQELYTGGQGAASKLSAADFHGAEVEVTRSGCSSRVGIKGIVIKDSRFVFEVVTTKNEVKIVPKEGTLFRVVIPAEGVTDVGDRKDGNEQQEKKLFIFEIHGDQFQVRSADRATRKFKGHFLKKL